MFSADVHSRLLVPTLAAFTCAIAGIATGLLGAAGTYQRAFDPERCAIRSTDTRQTVLTSDVGRVWTKELDDEDDGARVVRYYGCRNNAGRHVFLASVREASYEGEEGHFESHLAIRPEGIAANGATVAFAKVTCPDSSDARSCRSKLRVVRLDRDGGEARAPISRRHAIIDAPFLAEDGRLVYYGVEKPNTPLRGCGKGCEIHRVSRKGPDRVIDSGPDIRLESQALASNSDFFWRNGAEPRVYPPPAIP